MSTRNGVKITALSLVLGFMVQLVMSAWFLSSLDSRIEANHELILDIREEQKRRTGKVYSMDFLNQKLQWLAEKIKKLEDK